MINDCCYLRTAYAACPVSASHFGRTATRALCGGPAGRPRFYRGEEPRLRIRRFREAGGKPLRTKDDGPKTYQTAPEKFFAPRCKSSRETLCIRDNRARAAMRYVNARARAHTHSIAHTDKVGYMRASYVISSASRRIKKNEMKRNAVEKKIRTPYTL